MSGVMDKVRAKLTRRYSHKDKDLSTLDDAESADEETQEIINKEYTTAENDDANPLGRPGSHLHRMISYGNKKTEDQIARDAAEYEAAQKARAAQSTTTAPK